MLKQAYIKFKSLIYDDSGVAMAYTIMVFLFFFMLCVSTYAMAENIRQKMELQNACDAAAYSGAVVQADILSRIAVLNRALSWTYLQTNRRQMDRLVGRWASQVSTQHSIDEALAFASHCKCPHHPSRGIHYRASYTLDPDYTILMRNHLERSRLVGSRVNDATLTNEINQGISNINAIQSSLGTLRNGMNNYIYRACQNSLTTNTRMVENNDIFILLNGTQVSSNNPVPVASYFQNGNNETDFLAFSRHVPADMGNGVNVWWNLISGRIQRQYTGGLTARYTVAHFVYGCSVVYGCACAPVSRPVTITLPPGETSPVPVPTILSPNFFGRAGSIVVATRSQVNNPFVSVFGGDARRGLYGAFDGRTQFIWAISSARAGIRLNNDSAIPGFYRVLYPGPTANGYTNGTWNLCEEDWDAVMIPVSRAFSDASTGNWNGAPDSRAIFQSISDFPSDVASQINNHVRH